MNFNEIHEGMIKRKLKKEIHFYKDKNNPLVSQYLKYLTSRLKIKNPRKNNINKYWQSIDNLMFSLPWNRLDEVHKIIKINEFLQNNKKYSKLHGYDKLNSKLIKLVEEKKLKKDHVEYDEKEKKIISIKIIRKKKDKVYIDYK